MLTILVAIVALYTLTQLVPELYTALDLLIRSIVFVAGLPFIIAYAFYKNV